MQRKQLQCHCRPWLAPMPTHSAHKATNQNRIASTLLVYTQWYKGRDAKVGRATCAPCFGGVRHGHGHDHGNSAAVQPALLYMLCQHLQLAWYAVCRQSAQRSNASRAPTLVVPMFRRAQWPGGLRAWCTPAGREGGYQQARQKARYNKCWIRPPPNPPSKEERRGGQRCGLAQPLAAARNTQQPIPHAAACSACASPPCTPAQPASHSSFTGPFLSHY